MIWQKITQQENTDDDFLKDDNNEPFDELSLTHNLINLPGAESPISKTSSSSTTTRRRNNTNINNTAYNIDEYLKFSHLRVILILLQLKQFLVK